MSPGPVVTAAVHSGHDIRPELRRWMAISEDDRRRNEDPLTDFWLPLGDTTIRVNRSRFEVDLDRPRDLAVPDRAEPELRVWNLHPPPRVLQGSLELHDRFYASVHGILERLVDDWGAILVLDVRSRAAPLLGGEERASHPEVMLDTSAIDRQRFGRLAERFAQSLRECVPRDQPLVVGGFVPAEGDGYFTRWLYATYGDRVCTISVAFRNCFSDPWDGTADLAAIHQRRAGLAHAILAAREELDRCI